MSHTGVHLILVLNGDIATVKVKTNGIYLYVEPKHPPLFSMQGEEVQRRLPMPLIRGPSNGLQKM